MQYKKEPDTTNGEEKADDSDLFSQVIEAAPSIPTSQSLDGLFIGVLEACDETGLPMVSIAGLIDDPIPAQLICQLEPSQIGSQCAIMFTAGNINQPVIMGILRQTVIALEANTDDQAVIEENGHSIRVSAEKNIRFQCGKASIEMSADGRIELHGSTIVNHATGLNRIRGASVKLN